MALPEHPSAFLVDINGVLYTSHRPLPGAVSTIQKLQASGLPYRVATNNTTDSVATLSQGLQAMGLPIPPDAIVSAGSAAVRHLHQQGYTRILPLLTADAKADFAEFQLTEMDPEAVVLGDMGHDLSYHLLNRAFKAVMAGAELVALHKGRYWQWEAGLQLDVGAFVTGLEYATGMAATVVGKPSRSFYELAVTGWEIPASQIVMLGDDVVADVQGAQAAGLAGVLVQTGKYRTSDLQLGIQPDAVVATIADIQPWLGGRAAA